MHNGEKCKNEFQLKSDLTVYLRKN